MIIALEIETQLDDLGLSQSLIASSVESALAILEVREIDYAILDMNLGHETSEEIAEALRARGTPFLFLTGYDEATALARRFGDVPVLTKPFMASALSDALRQIGIG